MQHLNLLDAATAADWDQLVASHPRCTPFHCSGWGRVIAQTYGHKPRYVRFVANGRAIGVIPLVEVVSAFTGRRGVCLPFSDACSPLVFTRNGSNFIRDELSRLAVEHRWDYYEVRGEGALEEIVEPASSYYGHQISLSAGAENLFKRFRGSTKGAIRKASKTNLDVHILDTRQAVEEFYRLHVQTRRRHGAPPQPAKFFVNLHEHIVKAGLGFVVLACVGARAVAGAVFFHFGRRAVYKYAASDPKFGTTRGNNLVLWTAVQHLIERGADVLDLGRTAVDNAGLRRFKLSWGAEEELIRYYRFDVKPGRWTAPANGSTGFARNVFRNLPSQLNRVAGALVYPHLD